MPDKKLIIGGVIIVLVIIAIVLYMKYGRTSTTEVAPETQTTDEHNISPGDVVVPAPSSAVIPSGAAIPIPIPIPTPTGDVTPTPETKIIIPAPSTDVIIPVPATNIVVQPGSNIGNIIPSGRYIKISGSSPGGMTLNISEIQVFSTIGGPNIASGKTSTKSSGSNDTGNLTDGDLSNYAITSNQTNPWMQVDLGSNVPIASIVIVNRTDLWKIRLISSIVEIIDDSNAVVWKANPLQGLDGKTTPIYQAPADTVSKLDAPKTWTLNPPNPQAIIS